MSVANVDPQIESRIRTLLRKRLSGSAACVAAEIERACVIAAAINHRWRVPPTKWRFKHVDWYLRHSIGDFGEWRRYRHELALKRVLEALHRPAEWEANLPFNGPPKQAATQKGDSNVADV